MVTDHKPTSAGVWRMYAGFALNYPWLLTLVIVGGIAVQAANVVAPIFLRNFFNVLATQPRDAGAVHELVGILAIVGLFWLLEWAARRVQDVSTMYLEAHAMRDMYSSTFEYLLGHSYNFFLSRFAGSLTHKVSKFARGFEVLFDSVLIQFFPTFLFVLGAIVVLYLRNHTLGIALALWAIAFVAFQSYVAHLRQPIRAARAAAETKVTGDLADAISNQSNVTLFVGTRFEHSRFSHTIGLWQKATMRSWLADAWIWSGIGFFMIIVEAGLLFGGIYFWQKGLFTLGDFVLIQAYLLTTFDRLVTLNRELRRVYDAYADAAEMMEILSALHEVRDKPDAKPLEVAHGAIVLKRVGFFFSESSPIFKDFDLSIAGGEKVALVGPSGAGKSTLTRLILRLYDVKEGAIEIDGQNISDVTQDSLRSAIGFVPQEPILFHRSLMENIRYGRREASDEEVFEAAKKAHCHEFISKLPHGYDTHVGERGIKLSGGERQRIVIARAILKNAPILILDEATSSLDSESEALIQDSLSTLMQGKTTLVIAHRLSTIMKMDRIVVLAHGRIAAQGTHAELLAQDGLYRKLWNIQAGGFIGDA